MKANDYMIGGDHYRKGSGEQHWDRVYRLFGPGYFIGCITKYVERHLYKDGIKDLQKAKHFIEKLIELKQEENKRNEEESRARYSSLVQNGHGFAEPECD